MRLAILALLAVVTTDLSPAAAAVSRLGVFDDWQAYVVDEGKGKICYVHSVPKKSDGNYSRRGEVFMQITSRTTDKVANEVSFTAGYTFKDDAPVELQIDGQTFKLFTKGDTAWAYDGQADTAIVRAMIAGRELAVRGVSSRNTRTSDTFSLKGFTAAHRASQRACAGR